MPIFSIIIPAYNRKSFLKKAVESVLGQTFTDWELIIIDDGSTDGTRDLISKYNDYRINYIYQLNRGTSSARNQGVKRSGGEYISFLDSDDYWDKDKLKIHKEYIEQYPQYKIFHTQEIWYRRGVLLRQKKKHQKPSGSIFPDCLPLCCVSISTAVIHKTVFHEIGMFDESLPVCEDYDFWLRVSLGYPVFLIDKPLTIKDGGRPDQLSQRTGLDRYRIIALIKFLNNDPLTGAQHKLILDELIHKIKVYLNGCIKRNKFDEIDYYTGLLKQYDRTVSISCKQE